jgi:hypothetical protein
MAAMNTRRHIIASIIPLLSFLASVASGQGRKDAADEIVTLPELTVTARRIIPPPEPWRYTQMDGVEVLSNVSDGKARELLQNFIQSRNILRSIAPSMQVRNGAPLKMIICDGTEAFKQFVPAGQTVNQVAVTYKDGEQAYIVVNNDDTINEFDGLTADDNGIGGAAAAAMAGTAVPSTAPFASTDADSADDTGMDGFGIPQASGLKLDLNEHINRAYMKLCFSQMNPQPPAWFEEGMIQLFMRMRISGNIVTYAEVSGLEVSDLEGMAREMQGFKVELYKQKLMPMDALFAITRDSNTYKSAGTGKWAQQCAAFIHYCLYRNYSKLQPGLARFVAAASQRPVDEAFFKECFKTSYKDMLLELANYVEHSDARAEKYTFKEDTRPKAPEMRDAKDSEVGRMKGEALRLSGKPETGRSELLGPYTRRHVDPELLAALGLDELSQGTFSKAKTLLESAAKEKVVRPRVYVVLGRIYLAEWTEGENEGKKLTQEQLAAIQKLVLAARTQYPPMSAVYMLFADALAATGRPSTSEQLSVLVEGCKAYPENMDIVYKTANLIAESGDKKGARPLAEFGLKAATDSKDKLRFGELVARTSSQ